MRFLIPFALAAACAAQVPNLTGTWTLNAARSSWGSKEKPAAINLQIEHREPMLKYDGLVVDVHGEGRAFRFEATLDGTTTQSEFHSTNGLIVEEGLTRISRDGKVLTHRVRLTDPNGTLSWTEVYEKR